MLASALSMGSGAYLATKTEREVQEAEFRRERQELETHPEEEEEEIALFYQLKGVPEDEAKTLAKRLDGPARVRSQDAGQRGTWDCQSRPIQIHGSRRCRRRYRLPPEPSFRSSHSSSRAAIPAIIASFVISTLAHFMIGAAKTVVTGLSAWRSGAEMTVVGLGEAIITYLLGLGFGTMVH